MKNKLKEKYGLLTAICMVVGIVIGSGVFFKAGKVLSNTGANIGLSLLVVGIVGLIMIICSYVFATLASKYEKVNGIVDYAEATLGKGYAYFVGWFMSTMYYPILTSTLAWVSSQYACVLFNYQPSTAEHLAFATLFLICGYGVNTLSPKIAGYFQVSTTFIKLVPLVLMGIVGTVAGLINGLTVDAFRVDLTNEVVGGATINNNLFIAVAAFAFAYEGWIIATTINSEIKDGKKNLPIALILGSVIVIGIYLLYFLGLTGSLSTPDMVTAGGDLPKKAFSALLNSPVMGTVVMVFVVISCLGTMNGLMMGCCRGFYSLSVRDEGPSPETLAQVDDKTNMPQNSSILGLILCAVWLFQWQVFFFFNTAQGNGKIPLFWCWEGDEVSIITLYAIYIPIFIAMMIKCKDLHPVKRFVLPGLASLCCLFMCYCAYDAYKANGQIFSYLLVFGIIMFIGYLFYKGNFVIRFFKKVFGNKSKAEENTEE